MHVLVLGASGAIGGPVARAFRRAGYTVYGLVRSEEKGAVLAKQEIHPVIGDTNKPETWQHIAEKVSVIVNASADWADPITQVKIVNETVKQVSQKRKIVFIHTSGVWIFGSDSTVVKDENTPYTPLDLVKWRPAIDQSVIDLQSPTLSPIVLLPSSVYGYSHSLLGGWFQKALAGDLTVPGKATTRFNTVHVDDNAEAYVLAAQKADLVKGQTFIVANQSESLHDMLHAIARVTEYKGEIKYVEPQDPFSQGLAIELSVSTNKARNVLGWQPRHLGVVDEVDSLYLSWKALQ